MKKSDSEVQPLTGKQGYSFYKKAGFIDYAFTFSGKSVMETISDIEEMYTTPADRRAAFEAVIKRLQIMREQMMETYFNDNETALEKADGNYIPAVKIWTVEDALKKFEILIDMLPPVSDLPEEKPITVDERIKEAFSKFHNGEINGKIVLTLKVKVVAYIFRYLKKETCLFSCSVDRKVNSLFCMKDGSEFKRKSLLESDFYNIQDTDKQNADEIIDALKT